MKFQNIFINSNYKIKYKIIKKYKVQPTYNIVLRQCGTENDNIDIDLTESFSEHRTEQTCLSLFLAKIPYYLINRLISCK